MRNIQSIIDTDRCPVCLGLQGRWVYKDGEKKWVPCSHCKGKGKKRHL